MEQEKLIIRYIETTGRCNLDCPICVDRYRNFDMPMPDFYALVDANSELINGNRVWLDFSGEPLVDPHFFERVAYLKEHGAIMQISTNGLLLNEAICKKLLNSGIDYLVVSVSTLDPAIYKKIRGIDALTTVLANVDLMCKCKAEIGAKMHIQGVAIDTGNLDIPTFVDYFHSRGMHAAVHKFTNRAQCSRLDFPIRHIPLPTKRGACQGLKQNIAILANLDVVACCCDFMGRSTLGNLRDYDFSVEKLFADCGFDEMLAEQKRGIFRGACECCGDWIYHQKNSTEEYVTVYPLNGDPV